MVLPKEAEETIASLFPPENDPAASPGPQRTGTPTPYTVYPEELLHATPNGNKCYVGLQSLTRLFMDALGEENRAQSPGGAGPNRHSIVQFGLSRLSALLQQKVHLWDETDADHAGGPRDAPGRMSVPGSSAASSLFAWSSGDKYIAARKRELQQQRELAQRELPRRNGSDPARPEPEPAVPRTAGMAAWGLAPLISAGPLSSAGPLTSAGPLISAGPRGPETSLTVVLRTEPPSRPQPDTSPAGRATSRPELRETGPPQSEPLIRAAPSSGPPLARPRKSNLGRRLAAVVQRESNRFIQDRIDLIKAHHLKQASRKLDERRRRDHEMHLRRVQLKEEKYASILKAAIAAQNTKRNSGFFGALFGPRPVSNSFTLPVPGTGMAANTALQNGNPGLLASPPQGPGLALSPETHKTGPETSAQETRERAQPPKTAPLAPAAASESAGLSPLVSARSSLEFEAYQSSSANTMPSHAGGETTVGGQWHTTPQKAEAGPAENMLGLALLAPDNDAPSTAPPLGASAASDLLSL